MAQSIYGFAQAAPSGGSGVTEALRLYQRAIAQGANESGIIDNPDVFRQARDAYLAPFADDVRVSTKIADSMNDENQLRDKINDSALATSVFRQNVDDVMRDYAKEYYQSPENLIVTSSYVYNTAVEQLTEEVEARRVAGESFGDLQNLLNEYSEKADSMSRLTRELMTGTVRNPDAYGVFIRTNPDDGSIMDISIDKTDSTSRQSGFARTDAYYGNIPVYSTTVSTPQKDGTVVDIARIGDNQFTFNSEKNVLERQKKGNFWRRVGSFLPGGETPSEASAAIEAERRNLNTLNLRFGDVVALPAGSIMKDPAGTYYYQSNEGVYKASSKENLQRFLTNTGVQMPDVDAAAFPISRNEANGFGAFTSEDGTSRIIDDSFFNGQASETAGKQSYLPSLNQSIEGGFSSASAPLAMAPQSVAPVPGAGNQQPRKAYTVKEPRQIGITNPDDFMASEGEKFTRPMSGSIA